MLTSRGLGVVLFVSCLFWACCFAAVAAFAQADGPTYEPPVELATEPPSPEGQPSCPDLELEPFEGEDAAAGELRALRGEQAEFCAALSDRLDRLRERTWWLVAEQLQATEQRALANEKATAVVQGIEDLQLTLAPAEGVFEVEDSAGVSQSASVVEAVDASGEALKGALWFLIGLLAMLAGSALYRHLKP